MKIFIKRFIRRFKLRVSKLFKCRDFTPLTSEERNLVIVVAHLLANKDTDLLMHPDLHTFYIKSDVNGLFVIINFYNKTSCVINHVFGYDIKMSDRVSNYIRGMYIREVEVRRREMEKEYRNNIQHSLKNVINTIHNVNLVKKD